MASNAPIVVNDGVTPTPVAHSFSGDGIYGDQAKYSNRAEAFVGGRETLNLRMKANANVRTTVVTLKCPRVIEETINGVAVKRVVDFMTMKADIMVPIAWTKLQASERRPLLANLVSHAVVAAMADDGEFVW